MTIVYKLLPDGGFACGDTDTRRTSYAYPSSTHASQARRKPLAVAQRMMAQENAFSRSGLPDLGAEYDRLNWQRIGGKD